MFFSIVICSYNPNYLVFQKLLNAVLRLNEVSPDAEVIIVDNNSSPALQINSAVQSFLSSKQNATIITETKPGLTNARIAGIKAAKGDWIIFFDDDNEPANDYLIEAKRIVDQHFEVGAWGPGNINVEFVGAATPDWIQAKRHLFQERRSNQIQTDSKKTYQHCYPNGTGLVIKKSIALEYVRLSTQGVLTLSDRAGKSLSSGGDTQMVMLCIKNGFTVGVSPQLQMKHLIDTRKATCAYLKKQVYYTSSSYFKAVNEVFPEEKLIGGLAGNSDILKSLYAAYRIHFSAEEKNSFCLRWARILGEYAAPYNSRGLIKPFIVRMMEKYFINY